VKRVRISKNLLLLTIGAFLVLGLVTIPGLATVETTLRAPEVLMPYEPMDIMSVDISVSHVERLYGFEFILTFDPAVLMAVDYSANYPFIEEWPSEIGWGYVSLAFAAGPENPDGLTASGNADIATIDFIVLDYGWSPLDLGETTLSQITDLGAVALYHVVSDGLFANIDYRGCDLQGIRTEHGKWIPSKDPDNTLYGRVKNHGTVSTMALVEFIVRSEDGMWAKTFRTAPELLAPDETKSLSKTLLTGNLVGKGTYFVSAMCYYDVDGDDIVDVTGRHARATSFTLL
jgi:hypothetical protein